MDVNSSIFFEIEIVVDYCREVLSLSLPRMYVDKSKKNIRFTETSGSVPTFRLHLNNIRFFDGNDFYFDYTKNDKCFLYYNTSSMSCLKAKHGMAVTPNGKVVDKENCADLSDSKLYFYNEYTQEC